jgi:serine/threonine-protein kinase
MSDHPQQRYRVVEKLESGGMAEVFRAESEGLHGFRKQVAIKRVLPHLSSKTKFIQMFLDEARLSAQLTHSNCVQVFDIGVGDSTYFIVMEFVDGANLKSVVDSLRKQGREFPIEAALFICIEICKGLSYAHELTDQRGLPLQIVHRDISPPNVLITKFGEIKIVDFGLAKASTQLEKSEPGIIKGKFAYLSPELALGKEVDARADVFAVGIILWELLSGKRLFLGDTDYQTVKNIQAAVIPPLGPLNPLVTPELERIALRALAKDLDVRYRTARELGYDLTRLLFKLGKPVSAFDIASQVHFAMRDRVRQRPASSRIDKLIEDALFEFTSLTEGQEQPVVRPSKAPLPFHDFSKWISEIAPSSRPSDPYPLHQSLPPNLSEGNLALLEEDQGTPLASPSSSQSMQPFGTAGAAMKMGGNRIVGAVKAATSTMRSLPPVPAALVEAPSPAVDGAPQAASAAQPQATEGSRAWLYTLLVGLFLAGVAASLWAFRQRS